MRACVLCLRASANRLAARPQAVSSATTMDILNSGLYSAESRAGKRPRRQMIAVAFKTMLRLPRQTLFLLRLRVGHDLTGFLRPAALVACASDSHDIASPPDLALGPDAEYAVASRDQNVPGRRIEMPEVRPQTTEAGARSDRDTT